MYWPRGRVWGGSSSLNAMVYVRYPTKLKFNFGNLNWPSYQQRPCRRLQQMGEGGSIRMELWRCVAIFQEGSDSQWWRRWLQRSWWTSTCHKISWRGWTRSGLAKGRPTGRSVETFARKFNHTYNQWKGKFSHLGIID